MISKNTGLKILAGFMLAAILSGCTAATPTQAPAPVATSIPATAGPTLDLQPTLNSVRTQAVQTAVAALTQNAPTLAPTVAATSTLAPSATPAPTNTAVPTIALPTATIFWTVAPTFTTTPPAFACTITSMTPSATTGITAGSTFNAVWVVKNTGAGLWTSAETDVRYVSGTKLQTGGDILDLSANVANGQSYTVTIPMKAPATIGTYKETWNFVQGNNTFCKLDLTLLVK